MNMESNKYKKLIYLKIIYCIQFKNIVISSIIKMMVKKEDAKWRKKKHAIY